MTKLLKLLAFTFLSLKTISTALPVVDKGVFVITGVRTCGGSHGYCILGGDCTVDKEFAPDEDGHCDGLRKAFTPRAFFVCCRTVAGGNTTTITTTTTTTTTPPPSNTTAAISIESEEEENESSVATSVSEEEDSSSIKNNVNSGEEDVSLTTTTTEKAADIVMVSLVAVNQSDVDGTTTTGPVEIVEMEAFHLPGIVVTNNNSVSSTTPTAVVTTTPPVSNHPTGTTPTSNSILQTISTSTETSVSTHYSSCLVTSGTSSTPRGDRLAAEPTHSSTCWTGAITRTPSTSQPHPLLMDPGTFLCAGALISKTILVTTATCVSRLFGQDLKQFKVVLGANKLVHPSRGESQGFYRDVEELVIHEEYGVYGGVVRVNDVAIVKLSPPSLNESYCTICLPDNHEELDTFFNEECVVSGFSHPVSNSKQRQQNQQQDFMGESTLHSAPQHLEPAETCSVALANYSTNQYNENKFRTNANLETGLICASGKAQREACFSPRDAGSPLACPMVTRRRSGNNITTGYKLVGLFSSGFHCGTRQMPVVYTDLGAYLGWIKRFADRGN